MTANTITEYMCTDHKHCDSVFATLEQEVSAARWDAADTAMIEFAGEMDLHMNMEEYVLFPAFETATGNTAGPTTVMRSEHDQIRAMLAELRDTVARRDSAAFAGIAETLHIMLQQHNLKEEGILYPMTDSALGDTRHEIVERMTKLESPAQTNKAVAG